MSAPSQCPRCGTRLQPDWESCPNCPMSFRDEPPQKTAFQNDTFRGVVLPLMLFGGVIYFVWTLGGYLMRTAIEGTQISAEDAKKLVAEPPAAVRVEPAPLPLPAPAPRPQAVKPPVEDESSGAFTIPNGKIRPAAKATLAEEWKIRGVIYDLITLKPVPGVRLVFIDNVTNARAQIDADAQGRYRALLPALLGRGYLVTMSKPGYAATYLDPGITGVAELPRARRLELVKDLSSLISQPYDFEPDSEAPLVLDFYLPPL